MTTPPPSNVSSKIPICIFAKPPKPGRAKTRLAAKVGPDAACSLATAFLSDTLNYVVTFAQGGSGGGASSGDQDRSSSNNDSEHNGAADDDNSSGKNNCSWAIPILATTEDGMFEGSFPLEAYPPGVLPAEIQRWLQPEGDLGAKMEGIIRFGLDGGCPATICVGADSPGRPFSRLDNARKLLMDDGFDCVLGPTEDGGYDLIGLKQCPPGLLGDLPWSQPITFQKTTERLEERGYKVACLDKWWDVDEVEDLDRLKALVATSEGALLAPASKAVLDRLAQEDQQQEKQQQQQQ